MRTPARRAQGKKTARAGIRRARSDAKRGEPSKLNVAYKALAAQHAATAGILKVIASSPNDVQPVFDAIVDRCFELFRVGRVTLWLAAGERVEVHARRSASPEKTGAYGSAPLDRQSGVGRCVLDATLIHIPDMLQATDQFPRARQLGLSLDYRAAIFAPLMRDGKATGAISLLRPQPGPFSQTDIALLQTFADQAVIAIENARLFNETKEALERQTATAGILNVIASSPSDVQPVFDAIVHSAIPLMGGFSATLTLLEEGKLHLRAYTSTANVGDEEVKKYFPIPIEKADMGRAVRARVPVAITDFETDPSVAAGSRELARARGFRAVLFVPLILNEVAIGTLNVTRREPGAFTDHQVGLLKTFADQAVIAIENARLFNETKEALERQTATAEILKVISGSTTDTQPVFEAIVRAAVRLFPMANATIFMRDGDLMRLHAVDGAAVDETVRRELAAIYPIPFDPAISTSARAMVERRTNSCLDTEAPGVPDHIRRAGRAGRFRSNVVVPLVRDDEGIGSIVITHPQPGYRLNDKQLELLRLFADQAVIAIENVRLFNETKEALEQQTATAEILQVISGSVADSQPAFDRILQSCERLFGGLHLVIFLVGEDETLRVGAVRGDSAEKIKALFPAPVAGTATDVVIRERRAMTYANAMEGPDAPPGLRAIARRFGRAYSIAIAPMMWEDRGVGSILVSREKLEAFSDKDMALLRTFADQAVIAIQNARLFRQIREKSAQLEVANRHKSEFLANMSHELRTPLNAIIGFSEVLMEKMFGELNEKQADYLKDIHESGRHLLSLINDILDLSKIEAGRMELEVSTFDLRSAISNAMTLVRERAQRHGVQLAAELDPRLAEWRADERKVKQILLNLLSNAVKFTPEGGRVDVSARLDTDRVEIAVKDSGVGISAQDQAKLFEEFSQVGADATRKAEGTGLGLALTKKFVELHGGAIQVDSAPGSGSTFSFSLPSAAAARSASSG